MRTTAAAKLAEQAAAIREQIKALSAICEDMERKASVQEQVNWGHVGDAQAVRSALAELIQRFQ